MALSGSHSWQGEASGPRKPRRGEGKERLEGTAMRRQYLLYLLLHIYVCSLFEYLCCVFAYITL